MKTEVNNMLANYPVYDGVTILGILNNIDVTSLNLVPGAVRIQANVKGKYGNESCSFKVLVILKPIREIRLEKN